MNNDMREKAKKYGIYAVLAAALLISAAVSAVIDKKDSKRVIIYSTSETENNMAEDESSKAKSEKSKKVTTIKTSKVTEAKTTKQTTSKTSKTSKVSTSKTHKETSDKRADINFPIDINLVTFDELMAINGVGESTAYAILDLRDRLGLITYMEQLLEISGIGESKLAMLSEYLYVDDADYSPPPETVTEVHTTIPSETPPPEENDRKSPEDTASYVESEPNDERKTVNINEADKEELMQCLLIDEELAESILEIREQLGGKYENSLQLLYVKGISKNMLSEIKEYILLE
ncbi:MAG: helix-hairpin-helix domain-containing protein [Ruminococcus sp.]|uniref:ComEA family DNA-binding protein n=1 Tax=Ruminococcus sp. TaxID=41978 RepID=UPI0025D01295|nr:helix-hairpin-helix domain-containing protein [Ruminococcus sp.]MBO4866230.1 helix-hairpin-helix domain-containing protein [Ruminococcus sp.]